LQGFKIAEVVKTVIEDYNISYMTSMWVAMNKDKWNAISPADQKAIEKINAETIEIQGKLWVTLTDKAVEFAKGKRHFFTGFQGGRGCNGAEDAADF